MSPPHTQTDTIYKIGEYVLKMACFQVATGFENKVISDLEDECENQDEILDSLVLKSFGRYDLILLYLTPDFEYHLTKSKPIKGILKTNLFFCNFLEDSDPKVFLDTLRSNPFTGISFFKIESGHERDIKQLYQNAVLICQNAKYEKFVLGTLGWNEFIVFSTGRNLSLLTDNLFNNYTDEKNTKSNLKHIKSFSYLCIRADLLPTQKMITDGEKSTIDYLSSKNEFNLEVEESCNLSVFITIDARFIQKAIQYWTSMKFKVSLLLGRDDMMVRPFKGCSWAQFLCHLFIFRYDFQSKLMGTSTYFLKAHKGEVGGYVREQPPEDTEKNRIPYELLIISFGNSPITHNLTNVLSALYGLWSTPIVGDTFFTMVQYPKYLHKLSSEYKVVNKDTSTLAEKAIGSIKKGILNRSYGIHGNIEDIVHGRLSKLSGGFQRAIFAIECIPTLTLLKAGESWKGFTILGDRKYFHINEVIGLPENSLWNVHEWWPLYHEIGHVLIDRTPTLGSSPVWVSRNSEILKSFLTQKNNHTEWFKLITEFVAEVLGFELGFFGDLNLFFNLLWTHIDKIIPKEEEILFNSYLLRTFFVLIFEKHFRLGEISEDQMVSEDFLYKAFVDHITDVEKIINRDIKRKHFIAGVNSKTYAELFPFSKSIFNNIQEVTKYVQGFTKTPRKLWPDPSTKDSDLTKEIIKTIQDGQVWINEDDQFVPYEAVLYHIFKEGQQNLQTNIALILTFWHIHMDYKSSIKEPACMQQRD